MNCAQALRHLPYCGRNLLPALPPACTHRHRQLQQAPTSPRSKRLKDKNTHVRKRKQKREKKTGTIWIPSLESREALGKKGASREGLACRFQEWGSTADSVCSHYSQSLEPHPCSVSANWAFTQTSVGTPSRQQLTHPCGVGRVGAAHPSLQCEGNKKQHGGRQGGTYPRVDGRSLLPNCPIVYLPSHFNFILPGGTKGTQPWEKQDARSNIFC